MKLLKQDTWFIYNSLHTSLNTGVSDVRQLLSRSRLQQLDIYCTLSRPPFLWPHNRDVTMATNRRFLRVTESYSSQASGYYPSAWLKWHHYPLNSSVIFKLGQNGRSRSVMVTRDQARTFQFFRLSPWQYHKLWSHFMTWKMIQWRNNIYIENFIFMKWR